MKKVENREMPGKREKKKRGVQRERETEETGKRRVEKERQREGKWKRKLSGFAPSKFFSVTPVQKNHVLIGRRRLCCLGGLYERDHFYHYQIVTGKLYRHRSNVVCSLGSFQSTLLTKFPPICPPLFFTKQTILLAKFSSIFTSPYFSVYIIQNFPHNAL